MLVRKVILQLETGLHARPASELVKIASGFTSEIVLVKDGQEYNAKSILGLLSIGAGKGDEFIIKAPTPIKQLNEKLLEEKIIGGYRAQQDYPELENGWILAVTEKRTKEEIDMLVRKVGELCGKDH